MIDLSKQEQFLNVLRAKDAEVASELRNREGLAVQPEPDVFDQIQDALDRAITIETLDHTSAVRREVRDAIERIRSGEYGLCLACGEEIDPKRLAALPWAPLCLRCQQNVDAENVFPRMAQVLL